jgi:hypothetical protein
MVALRRDDGDTPFGPGKNREAKAPRPSVEARVAAAALRLQQAGELNAAEALLMLVAGDAAPPAAELMLVAGDAAPPAAEQNELGDPRAGGGKWHADAKRLRVDGLSVREIADRIGRSASAIYWVLDENGEWQETRQDVNPPRSRRAAHYERCHDETVVHSKHEIRAVLPPHEVKMAAIKSFAAGEITAAELSLILRTYDSLRPPKGERP